MNTNENQDQLDQPASDPIATDAGDQLDAGAGDQLDQVASQDPATGQPIGIDGEAGSVPPVDEPGAVPPPADELLDEHGDPIDQAAADWLEDEHARSLARLQADVTQPNPYSPGFGVTGKFPAGGVQDDQAEPETEDERQAANGNGEDDQE